MKASGLKSRRADSRPACAMRATSPALAGSIVQPIASRNAAASPGGTINPVPPSST